MFRALAQPEHSFKHFQGYSDILRDVQPHLQEEKYDFSMVNIEEKFHLNLLGKYSEKTHALNPFPTSPVSVKDCKAQCTQLFVKVFLKILCKSSIHFLL